MPNENENGKAGTIKPEEFEALQGAAQAYGENVIASKVAKICLKNSEKFLHENPNSIVGVAYKSLGDKIGTVTGTVRGVVNRDIFQSLSSMVNTYGAEVVVWKLAKIASRRSKEATARGDVATANGLKTVSMSLKGLFPRQE